MTRYEVVSVYSVSSQMQPVEVEPFKNTGACATICVEWNAKAYRG